MFFAHGREHVNLYYNLLGILKLENIYRLKVSLFTYKLKFSAVKKSGNLHHLNLNVFKRYLKSGIKDFFLVLKTDHNLTVSYIR